MEVSESNTLLVLQKKCEWTDNLLFQYFADTTSYTLILYSYAALSLRVICQEKLADTALLQTKDVSYDTESALYSHEVTCALGVF